MADTPGTVVPVSGGGTNRGIRAVIDGTAHIAMVSTPTDDSLRKRAGSAGVTLATTVIARDGIVPCVHPSNPVAGLTLDQLRDVFSGAIASWKGLGGPDRPIALVTSTPSGSTYGAWMAMVMDTETMSPGATVVDEDSDVVAKLGKNPDAIGYVASQWLGDAVKPLAVNGVTASAGTIAAGTYPLTRDLSVAATKPAAEATDRFVAYLLDSSKGRRILARAGYVIPS